MTRTTSSQQPRPISVSVREMVEFVLRTGDLGGGGDFLAPSRALQGTRGHQRLQKRRPEGYQSEVRVQHQVPCERFVLTIKGRVDGVLLTPRSLLVEEIKTVMGRWNKEADPLHWAQAKIYAFIFASQNGNPKQVEIQLTYLDLESDQVTEFRDSFKLEDLRQFFDQVTSIYVQWAARQQEWIELRDDSITRLAFSHAEYRPGQRALAVAAYRALANGSKLFAEAPTGIGKTVSVLFPAIKALGEGHLEKIFFLTAKTTGRAIAQSAVAIMQQSGLRLRTLTITAKDKICFNSGQPCEVTTCPFAIGYYDRIKAALLEALSRDSLEQPEIEAIARLHNVCPFALSLDVSSWVDLIVCDYNYVFDPKASLKRFFSEEGGDYGFLVDEAHNLVDRAREMFSADLNRSEIAGLKTELIERIPSCAKALGKMEKLFAGFRNAAQSQEVSRPALVTREAPVALLVAIRKFLEQAEEWLARNEAADFRAALLDVYFRCLGFARTADLYDERYVTIFETSAEGERLRLFCIDPAQGIRNALARGKSALFFSATLRPLEFYREVLGGDFGDSVLQLQSPFPTGNLAILVQDQIQTDFRRRDGSYDNIARCIASLVQSHPGNYLIFFPSYKYLEAVRSAFETENPFVPVICQNPSMPENERQKFLDAFQSELTRPLVGFAVMGGLFGEGIDLVGERLVGAVVVGVGLPQLSLERDLIREYFDQKNGLGFEYAYTYPGLNRVVQAAGRVIRSETDRGVVLLIDRRFAQPRYQEMLPQWWSVNSVRKDSEIAARVQNFWSSCATK